MIISFAGPSGAVSVARQLGLEQLVEFTTVRLLQLGKRNAFAGIHCCHLSKLRLDL
ncbi:MULTISPECIES: hypothetical protein [Bradyrhizobium]|uniref:hypothetical protein n=1 Tax=Bradyrhizobium TaxID=374 RepID=UPI0012E36812|nr:hypothetical protein [Bradyrhizobium retamae]